jgi:uncharacterized protein (TIGR02246 family)
MKNLILIVILISISSSLFAQQFDKKKEEQKIENIIAGIVDAWTRGDAQSFANYFAEDADFIVWFGLHMQGRKDIAFGHNIIFKDFYANTTWNLKINKIRFLGENVALAYASGAVVKNGDPIPEEPDAVPLIVLNRIKNDWQIISFQNTLYAVKEFRENGDINRMKRIMNESADK